MCIKLMKKHQQSTLILVSANTAGEQIPNPGQRVVDIMSLGVTLPKTGDCWSRVPHTENDTSTNPQSTLKQTQIQ